MANTDYIPFGEDWKKEMSKFPKSQIIDMLGASQIIDMLGASQIALNETKKWLLETTQNLAHPAYGHSSSTTIGIDGLRDRAFDFLGIPKED